MQLFEIIGVLFIVSSSFTLLIHLLVFAAVFLERKRTTANAFYTIYMIWNNATQLICTAIQLASIFLGGYAFMFFLQPYRIKSSFGGVVTVYRLREAKEILMGGTIHQSINGLILIFLYIVILHDVRMEMRRVRMASRSTSSHHDSSLLKVALIVCSVEILSVVQVLAQTQYVVRDMSTIIYVIRTAIYTTIPPYLLIVFSENVRQRVLLFF
ncbi:hypothetical protein PMAYCL1PPCAC_11636, partial [Pristionchus mayeri]